MKRGILTNFIESSSNSSSFSLEDKEHKFIHRLDSLMSSGINRANPFSILLIFTNHSAIIYFLHTYIIFSFVLIFFLHCLGVFCLLLTWHFFLSTYDVLDESTMP